MRVGDAMDLSAELCAVMSNRLAEIPELAGMVERFLQAFDVPGPTIFQINLALEELIANTINYGYRDDGDYAIRVTIAMAGREISIRIEDDAAPFDPFARAPVDTAAAIDDRGIGGLGIHLVKEMIDRVDYRRVGDRNHVTLRHSYAPAAADDRVGERED